MDKDILKKYADIKNQIKLLELEADSLNPEIMAAIIASGADAAETDFGTFTVGKRRTYTYPENLKNDEARLKEAKKEAEALGTATYIEKPYLVYKQSSAKEDAE